MRRTRVLGWLLTAVLALATWRPVAESAPVPPPPPPNDDPGVAPPAPIPNAESTSTFRARVAAEPTEHGLPINLVTALQLAGATPLDIAAADAQVRQSLALLLQARALWIPTLNGGIDYFRHDGVQQNIFTGGLFVKGRQSFLVGGGPTLSVGLTDAIFAPLAARRVVASRRADLQAARNDALQSVTQAYFDLQEARGRLLGAIASGERAKRLVDYARGLAPTLIAPLEINRSRTELQNLKQAQQLAIQDWRIASARLSEILLLDPAVLLEPIEPPFLLLTMIPSDQSAESLLPVALQNRPEIASRRELVEAARQLLNREKGRPLLPYVVATNPTTSSGLIGAGNYAGGPNQQLSQNGSRADFEVAVVWELQNMGFGNAGLIKQRHAERDLASIELSRTIFRVKSEVAQALARLQTARVRVEETKVELEQAVESADKNFIGLRETTRPAGELLRLVVRPQEVVAAIIALNVAFQDYSNAINEANRAQFALYRALGQPAQWITSKAAEPPAVQPLPHPPVPPAAPNLSDVPPIR